MAKIVLGLFFAVACIAGRIDGCFAQSNFYEGKTLVGFVPEASAQPVADFYRGKTIRVVIGSGIL